MSDRLKFKISQGADEVYAEKHDDGAWFVMATKAGQVVGRYQIPVTAAEVDVFGSIRVTLSAMQVTT